MDFRGPVFAYSLFAVFIFLWESDLCFIWIYYIITSKS